MAMQWGTQTTNATGGNVTLGRQAGFDNATYSRSGTSVTFTRGGRMGMGGNISGTTTYSTNQFSVWILAGGTKYNPKASGTASVANTWYTSTASGAHTVALTTNSVAFNIGFGWNAATSTQGTTSSVTATGIPTAGAPSGSVTHSSVTATSAVITGAVSSWGSYAAAGSQAISYGTTTSYGTAVTSGATITGLTPSTTYYYRNIITNNASLTATYTGSFTTLAATAPSVTITELDRTLDSIQVRGNGTNGTGTINRYDFSKDGGSTWINNGNNNTYTFTGLVPATTYAIRIRVYDQYTNGTSSIMNITTRAGFNNIIYTVTNNSIKIEAIPHPEVSVRGYLFSKDNGATWTTEQVSPIYTFTGLEEDTYYSVLVRMMTTAGDAVTEGDNLKTIAPPTIIGMTAIITATTIALNNIDTTNETTEQLMFRFSRDSGTTFSEWQYDNNYLFTGLSPYTSYNIQIQTKNVFNQIGIDNEVIRTYPTPPYIIDVVPTEKTPLSVTVQVNAVSASVLEYNYSYNGVDWGDWTSSKVFEFTGLSPSTDYEFFVMVRDAYNQTAQKSLQTSSGGGFKPRALRDGNTNIVPLTVAECVYLEDGATTLDEVIYNSVQSSDKSVTDLVELSQEEWDDLIDNEGLVPGQTYFVREDEEESPTPTPSGVGNISKVIRVDRPFNSAGFSDITVWFEPGDLTYQCMLEINLVLYCRSYSNGILMYFPTSSADGNKDNATGYKPFRSWGMQNEWGTIGTGTAPTQTNSPTQNQSVTNVRIGYTSDGYRAIAKIFMNIENQFVTGHYQYTGSGANSATARLWHGGFQSDNGSNKLTGIRIFSDAGSGNPGFYFANMEVIIHRQPGNDRTDFNTLEGGN